MTEAEQTGSVTSRFGWTKAGAERVAPSRTAFPAALVMAGVLLLLLLAGGAWIGSQSAHYASSSESPEAARFLTVVNRWQWVAMIATGALCAVLFISIFRLRRESAQATQALFQREESVKAELRILRTELAARARSEQDINAERTGLNSQLAELSRANAALTAELDRRRTTERNLSQQQVELVRSKDVLQLHVQARTQELEKLQRRSELILNSAGDGICGFDLTGKINFVNPAAARILGVAVEELIGLPEREIFAGFRADAGNHPAEIVATRRDGSTFVAEFVRSPLTEGNRAVGEVVVFKDITERKHAEEALALKATELARSNAELEQFAFVASHDLQEPLRKIQAFGDRLKTKCDEARLDAGRDYLERMQSAAARMRRLIDDLLTFSRVISRTEPFVPVSLNTAVKEVLSDLEVSLEKTGAKIEVGELPTIEADAVQMRQLLQNLIGNALKFQPAGATPVVSIRGRLVAPAAVSGQTAFLARKPGEAGVVEEQLCELVVQDNGIGFEEKYLDKIFAVFQRLHGRQEYEGTGVGLAVCRRIVDRHGGKITAQSQPGAGATFIVTLPVRQKPVTAKAA